MYRPSYLILSELYNTLPTSWLVNYEIDQDLQEELAKDGNVCLVRNMPIDLTTLSGLHWFAVLSGITVTYDPNLNVLGKYTSNRHIYLKPGRSQPEIFKTLLHELVHAAQHRNYKAGGHEIKPIFILSYPTLSYIRASSHYLEKLKEMEKAFLQERLRCEREAFMAMDLPVFKELPTGKALIMVNPELDDYIPSIPRNKAKTIVASVAMLVSLLIPLCVPSKLANSIPATAGIECKVNWEAMNQPTPFD